MKILDAIDEMIKGPDLKKNNLYLKYETDEGYIEGGRSPWTSILSDDCFIIYSIELKPEFIGKGIFSNILKRIASYDEINSIIILEVHGYKLISILSNYKLLEIPFVPCQYDFEWYRNNSAKLIMQKKAPWAKFGESWGVIDIKNGWIKESADSINVQGDLPPSIHPSSVS